METIEQKLTELKNELRLTEVQYQQIYNVDVDAWDHDRKALIETEGLLYRIRLLERTISDFNS